MVSYPFYISFGIFCFSIASIFLVYYLREKKNKFLIFSLLFWTLASRGTEFYMMYVPVFFFIAYFESEQSGIKKTILDALNNIKWHILVTAILFIAYIIFRIYANNVYDGNQVSFHLYPMIHSWFVYTFGLFPGYRFYVMTQELSKQDIFELIDFNMLLAASLLIYILVALKEKIQTTDFSSKNYIFILLALTYVIFAQNFLISLTTKYQYWVSFHGVTDYVYSSFSFFAIIIFILVLVLRIKSKILYNILAIVMGILVVITQINNKYVGQKQAHYSEKYFLLDVLLKTSYIKDHELDSAILAPSLWDEMTISKEDWIQEWTRTVWSRYTKTKIGKDIKIVRFASGKEVGKIEYIRSSENKGSFMTYSENGILKALVTDAKKCDTMHPCYLTSVDSQETGSIMDTFINNNLIYKAEKISRPMHKNIYGINVYDVKSHMRDDNTFLLEYDPSETFTKLVEFQSGFYAMESDGTNSWIWAFENGKINIKSSKDQKVNLAITIRTVSKRDMTFALNDTLKTESFTDTNPKEILLEVNLNKGNNILDIATNQQAIKLNDADNRKFAFCLFDIKVLK